MNHGGGGVRAGDYREPINPFDYTHRCDKRASYVPKVRPLTTPEWSKTTDKTADNFGATRGSGIP